MGKLWMLSQRIDEIISRMGLDKAKTRGRIALRAGVILVFDKKTPDDPVRIAKGRQAVKEVLVMRWGSPCSGHSFIK